MNGAAAFRLSFDSNLAQFRQHRGVRQVKKKGGRKETKKNAVLEESGQSLRLNLALFLDRSTSAGIVDVLAIYGKERRDCGNGEQRGNHEDCTVTKFVAGITDEQSAKHVASGIECLILPKLLAKSTGPNNPKCDGRNSGPEKRS